MIARIAASLAATAAAVILLSGLAISPRSGVFGLTPAGALSLYFVIWWTALFAVLPFGVRSQHEDGAVTPGTDPGAPSLPRLREKAVWTTLSPARCSSRPRLAAAAGRPLGAQNKKQGQGLAGMRCTRLSNPGLSRRPPTNAANWGRYSSRDLGPPFTRRGEALIGRSRTGCHAFVQPPAHFVQIACRSGADLLQSRAEFRNPTAAGGAGGPIGLCFAGGRVV